MRLKEHTMRTTMHLESLSKLLFATTLVGLLPAQYQGEWPLDAATGFVATDISGNGNDGTLNNFSGTPWTAGMFGNALQFDGLDDYVSTISQTSIYDGLGSPYSVAYWVKAPAQPNTFVYAEGTIGTQAILIFGSGQYLADADKFRVYCRNDQGTVPFTGLSNAVVYDDTWHHVVFVDVSGEITLYIDGVLDTSNLVYDPMLLPGSPAYGTYSFNTASVGALRRGTLCCHMDGVVDDLRLYRFAMSPLDAQLAMLGVPLLPPSASIGDYGVGCGSGPLDLEGSGSAVLGGVGLQLQMQSGPPNGLGFLVCGLGDIAPFDLGLVGYPGCTAYVTPAASAFVGVIDASGSSPTFTLPVPLNSALLLAQVNCQGVALIGNALEFSDVVMAVLGN
jgi:hypothetical protein